VFSKVLVTGGAGFIGSHVVDRLAEMGVEVLVVDNLFTGKVENLQKALEHGNVRFFEGDIRDGGIVERVVGEVEAVVHLAAIASVPFSVENPVLTNDVNVGGTLNLLDACVRKDVQRFVFVSSCAVYGEPSYLPVDEEHPVKPLSPYAASKVSAEVYCEVFGRVYGLGVVVLRLFNVYGSRQRGEDDYSGVISKFLENMACGRPLVVFGDGEQTRDFVHVDDVVDAVLLALESEGAVGEVFNVGSGRSVSVNELVGVMGEVFGVEVEVVYEKERAGDIRASCSDISKAQRILGYRPRVTLESGLRRLVLECKGKVCS